MAKDTYEFVTWNPTADDTFSANGSTGNVNMGVYSAVLTGTGYPQTGVGQQLINQMPSGSYPSEQVGFLFFIFIIS